MACRVVWAVVCLILAAGVLAKEPEPCCWISQMTGQAEIQSTTELEDGTIVLEETETEWAYDETFEAEAFIYTTVFENGTTLEGRFAYFYSRGVAFYIEKNQGTERCFSFRIPAQFPRRCLPDIAEFRGNRTFGDNALVGDFWGIDTVVGGYIRNISILLQADYCVPISLGYVSQEPATFAIAYGNIRLGICDPEKYFKVPDECFQGDVTSLGEKAKHYHRILSVYDSGRF